MFSELGSADDAPPAALVLVSDSCRRITVPLTPRAHFEPAASTIPLALPAAETWLQTATHVDEFADPAPQEHLLLAPPAAQSSERA